MASAAIRHRLKADMAELPDHDATQISRSPTFEASTKRVATLVVVRGNDLGRHYPLRRNRVVIGRGETADVLVHSKEISRAHAAIEGLRMGAEMIYRLSDLQSTNHIFVNGRQVDAHVLADGDKIQLGDVMLSFELHDAIDSKFHTEIRNRIRYDELTGLLAYDSSRAALAWELERYASAARGCAVVMMDLDDFKKCNDRYGHVVGSAVLAGVGELIRVNVRHFDVASRYGGEEFVAYFPETKAAEALLAADRLRVLIEQQVFRHHDVEVHITISMGISHFPQDGPKLQELVQVADERLYRAKREGKNRVYGED
jgi:diguanylate cyclase (GGDEF)-like protein